MDTVFQHHPVAHEMEPEAGPLPLGADLRVREPYRRHEIAPGELARTHASILSVLQASGARPFTFCASAISTSHPMSSRLSWTKRAPFIDSMAALTGPPRAATSLAR